ncbi:oligosaccharyl transferase, archaeosortase A system-associated [Halocatena marina]|uniref:oligosaccharyl transferase, archaeosortase A system-associated n=1 Tax=Halocatena marina TaxID=2934937 RepID=UPI00200CBEB7|nr:oligosaccharyl transferase, archaeosortase A system-associated [Halocatena marina]
MSQRTERWLTLDRDVLYERAVALYHVPVLVLLIAFMFWNRARMWEKFVTNDRVYFSGNDAWYHLRQTTYTVHNWPTTMPFDPWTNFPAGTASGQFGTFYDQIVATVALIIGLGSPSQQTIALTLLFAPAVIGAVTAIPVYFIGRRISGRLGGVTAVLVLSLTAGGFLQRSLVGFSDHHAAEALFQALAFLAIMVALRVASEEKPVYELVAARETEPLSRPFGVAALAGLAIALYIWVWPPGIVIAAVLSIFFVLQLSLEYVRGESPEHTAIVGIVAFAVAGVLTAVRISTFTFTATDPSLLQPALLFTVALGLVVMAAFARVFDSRNINRWLYPVLILGGIVLTVGTVAVALPDLYSYMVSQSLRFIGLSTTAAQRTVIEAQPLGLEKGTQNYWIEVMNYTYGIAFYSAAIGALIAITRIAIDDESRPEELLIVVWGVFMTMAVFTQVRFNYYLALPVAVLNGYLVGTIVDFLGISTIDRLDDLEIHQVVTLVIVCFLITGPFIMLGSAGSSGASSGSGSGGSQGFGLLTTEAASTGPNGIEWDSSLEWLSNNTPEEGQYGHPDAEPMDYYGTYEPTEDYDYKPGAYGVLSWWDYGHWITVLGERIPTANPFQQGAQKSADFLLSSNESDATDLIDGNESTRYVMVDWQIVSIYSKYGAPTQFESNDTISKSDLVFPLYQSTEEGSYQRITYVPTQRHYESMRIRLYSFNGSAVEPKPTVLDWETRQVRSANGETISIRVVPGEDQGPPVKQFDNMSAAREFVKQDGSSRVGLVGNMPSERIPALKHYRLVHGSQERGPSYVNGQPWVKTFERVPGATVNGTASPNTNVTASVTMRIPTTNETFVYRQHAQTDAQGQFAMTLPYSTTGYDKWSPENGHTNVSVRATGPYTFTTNDNATGTANNTTANNTTENGTTTEAEVTEAQVIGEDNSTVRVTVGSNDSDTNNDTNDGTTNETSEAKLEGKLGESAMNTDSIGNTALVQTQLANNALEQRATVV